MVPKAPLRSLTGPNGIQLRFPHFCFVCPKKSALSYPADRSSPLASYMVGKKNHQGWLLSLLSEKSEKIRIRSSVSGYRCPIHVLLIIRQCSKTREKKKKRKIYNANSHFRRKFIATTGKSRGRLTSDQHNWPQAISDHTYVLCLLLRHSQAGTRHSHEFF